MINIDQYAYASKLKTIDPMQKFIFSMLTLCVCLWADQIIISIVICFIMGYVTIKLGGTPLPVFVKLLFVPMTFLVIGVLTIAFNISSRPEIFYVSIPIGHTYLGVSKLGILQAIRLFFKVFGSVSCLYFLSLSTPMVDVLSVLRRLKVPSLVVEMMSLIYRFIFVLLETADKMVISQNARLGYINLKRGYHSLGTLASTLFIRAYKKSNDLYTSLESRGYEGDLNVIEQPYEKSTKIIMAAFIVNILLIFLALSLK